MQNELMEKKQIETLLKNAKHIAVVPSTMSQIDSFCAGVGLFYIIKYYIDNLPEDEAKNKKVEFIYTQPIPNVCTNLIKKEDIVSDILHRELVVTIDYSNTPAEKIQYNTDHDVLSLKISPVDKNFDLSRIRTRVSGFEFDLVFTIGMQSADDLRQMYTGLEREFSGTKTVNIDNTSLNQRFGYLNYIDTAADTLSLAILQKGVEWGLKPDSRASKALLTGITHKESTAIVPS